MKKIMCLFLLCTFLFTGCTIPESSSNDMSDNIASSFSSSSISSLKEEVFPKFQEYITMDGFGSDLTAHEKEELEDASIAIKGIVYGYSRENHSTYLLVRVGGNKNTVWAIKVSPKYKGDLEKMKRLFPIGEKIEIYRSFIGKVYFSDYSESFPALSIELPEKSTENHQLIDVKTEISYVWTDFLKENISPIFISPPSTFERPQKYSLESFLTEEEIATIDFQEQFGQRYWVNPFSEGRALIVDLETYGWPYGYIDMQGECVIPLDYITPPSGGSISYTSSEFHEGLAAVYRDEKYQYINKKGEVVIELPANVTNASPFSNGIAKVSIDDDSDFGKVLYINKSGEFVGDFQAPFEYNFVYQENTEKLYPIIDENEKYGFMNSFGTVVISPKYLDVQNFSEGLSAVKFENGLWGYIDTNGKTIFQPKFTLADQFFNGLALVSQKERQDSGEMDTFAYMNRKGKIITEENNNFSYYLQMSHAPSLWNSYFHGILAFQYDTYNYICGAINMQGQSADFFTDLRNYPIQNFEKSVVNEYTFNNKSGSLFLFDDRTVEIYDSFGELKYTGLWVANGSDVEDNIVIQLDGISGILSGNTDFNRYKNVDFIPDIKLYSNYIEDENVKTLLDWDAETPFNIYW